MSKRSGNSSRRDTREGRREFLKNSTVAVGAGLLATSGSGATESISMASFTTEQQTLIDVWNAHTQAEFEKKDADAAIATMTDHPVLIHVPVGTGASGKEPLRRFYAEVFIPQMPPDIELQLLTRSVGQGRVIDEFIIEFTHTVRMDWFAPGVEPTGRRLKVPHVGIVAFEADRISSEHIYWDQATVLAQLGLITPELPILADEQADRLVDPNAPANALINRLSI